LILTAALFYFAYANNNKDGKSAEQIQFEEESFFWVRSIYIFYSNFAIVIAYIVTYIKFRNHYLKLQIQYQDQLTEEDVTLMKKDISSLLILIISICQIYIIRIVRDLSAKLNLDSVHPYLVNSMYLSKSIMVLGICVAIHYRLRNSRSEEAKDAQDPGAGRQSRRFSILSQTDVEEVARTMMRTSVNCDSDPLASSQQNALSGDLR
jgi:hypothetical protein